MPLSAASGTVSPGDLRFTPSLCDLSQGQTRWNNIVGMQLPPPAPFQPMNPDVGGTAFSNIPDLDFSAVRSVGGGFNPGYTAFIPTNFNFGDVPDSAADPGVLNVPQTQMTETSNEDSTAENHGYKFESDTDTEITILKELEGSFAFIFKSTDKKLKVDFVDVEFAGTEADTKAVESFVPPTSPTSWLAPPSLGPKISHRRSRNFMSEDGVPQPIEFFITSDTAAIIEHTKRVLYLEDDDIAHIAEGQLHIHHLCRNEPGQPNTHATPTLHAQLQQKRNSTHAFRRPHPTPHTSDNTASLTSHAGTGCAFSTALTFQPHPSSQSLALLNLNFN
ncbi:hypothetical protein BU15DRAFT_76440 [Melanogaster broomeanus]|nr:hypothetical protein BU15DRAFT_76440 [Melanogaster broomeanus]